ncbi:MAG: GTP-binding protein [Candidatus Latescibacterota bacterium]|nr:MAG: GTP-binding protein [Candidatus Latescibacterota bacterium]
MPANLPPQYFEAEEEFRQAKTPQEKIEAIKKMIAIMPKHKGTEKLHAYLRRKLAQLSKEAQRKPKVSRSSPIDRIKKEGAGQAALAGPPNTGKSRLLSALTRARPFVAPYPFSTFLPTPGMMPYEDIQVQLIDLPPLHPDTTEPWVYHLIRSSDLVLVVVSLSEDPEGQALEALELLEDAKVRLTGEGAKPGILVANMADLDGAEERARPLGALGMPVVLVSAETGYGLEELKEEIFRRLGVVRVYTKEPGHKPDMDKPYVLPKGSTVLDLAAAIHKDLAKNFRYARIWRKGQYEGMRAPRDLEVQDGDILEVHGG